MFPTFLECSQMSGSVLSRCNTRLKLLHLLYDIDFTLARKERFFFVLYSDNTWVFDQSEREPGPIYLIIYFVV